MGLKGQKFRFRMSDTEICECGEQAETAVRYLSDCRTHIDYRTAMLDNLRKINVAPTLQNPIGGRSFALSIENSIVKIVLKFIQNTKNMRLL